MSDLATFLETGTLKNVLIGMTVEETHLRLGSPEATGQWKKNITFEKYGEVTVCFRDSVVTGLSFEPITSAGDASSWAKTKALMDEVGIVLRENAALTFADQYAFSSPVGVSVVVVPDDDSCECYFGESF